MGPLHAHSLEQGIFALLDRRMGKRRFPAFQTEDTLDCALLEGELASELLAALRERDLTFIHRSMITSLWILRVRQPSPAAGFCGYFLFFWARAPLITSVISWVMAACLARL